MGKILASAPYRIPEAAQLPERLEAVLTVIYLIFTEGHTATTGEELTRPDLCEEAIRLARALEELLSEEPEVLGLLALLLLIHARRAARTDPSGSLIRLSEQDRTLWNSALVAEGHKLVLVCLKRNQPGPFQIQAAIAAVHADAATAEETDWEQIVALYDKLYAARRDPVIALNRAVAIAERSGAITGLAALAAPTKRRSPRTSRFTPPGPTCSCEPDTPLKP